MAKPVTTTQEIKVIHFEYKIAARHTIKRVEGNRIIDPVDLVQLTNEIAMDLNMSGFFVHPLEEDISFANSANNQETIKLPRLNVTLVDNWGGDGSTLCVDILNDLVANGPWKERTVGLASSMIEEKIRRHLKLAPGQTFG